MLTGIGLRNFKAFGDEMQEAPLSKITLIYGPNSGGKSLIIQALLLLKQSLKDIYPYKERLLVSRGEYADLGSFQSLMHRHNLGRRLGVSLQYQIDNPKNKLICKVSMTFNRVSELSEVCYKIASSDSAVPLLVADSATANSKANPFGLSRWLFGVIESNRPIEGIGPDAQPRFLHYFALPNLDRASELARRREEILGQQVEDARARAAEFARKREEELDYEEWDEPESELIWHAEEEPDVEEEEVPLRIYSWALEEKDKEIEEEEARARELERMREEELEEEEERELEVAWRLEDEQAQVQELTRSLSDMMELYALEPENIPDDYERCLRSINYLGPLRSVPERLYRLSSENDNSAGVTGIQGEFSANVLYHNARFRREVNYWFNKDKFDIPYELEVVKWGEPSLAGEYITIALTDKRTDTQVTLADVGYGINQILPVIIEGIASQEGAILCVEQPEIHLHPRLQANIADLMIETIADEPGKRKQWIVETHSELLIRRIRTRIAQGDISPSDVSVLYVDPDDDDCEGSAIKQLRLDENGRFLNEWPHGFFDEGYKQSRLARRARLAKDNKNAGKVRN